MKRWHFEWCPFYWGLGRVEAGGRRGHRVYGYAWCFGPIEVQRWYGPVGINGELTVRGA